MSEETPNQEVAATTPRTPRRRARPPRTFNASKRLKNLKKSLKYPGSLRDFAATKISEGGEGEELAQKWLVAKEFANRSPIRKPRMAKKAAEPKQKAKAKTSKPDE